MTLFLASLSAGRKGSETLYDHNRDLIEVRESDCLRYLPAKRPLKVCPPDDTEEDDDEDDDNE